MSVYRETGQAGPGSSGSRILIIPSRKPGIGLRRSGKSGGQDLHSSHVPWLKRGIHNFVAMGENEPSAASAAQPGKHTCAPRSSGASLPCVWDLVLLPAVSTPGDLSLRVSWGKEEIHITHLCNA